MQVLESTPAPQSMEEEEEDDDDLPELPWKKVASAAALSDGTGLDDKNQVQTADKAMAAPPAVMNPIAAAPIAAAAVTAAFVAPAAIAVAPTAAAQVAAFAASS